jgi:hypothetical protein
VDLAQCLWGWDGGRGREQGMEEHVLQCLDDGQIEPSVAPGMQFCSTHVTTTETSGQALPLSLDPPQDAPSPAHACPTPTPPTHLK